MNQGYLSLVHFLLRNGDAHMKNWNAIDLHMHTVVGTTRDGGKDDVSFTYQQFVRVANKHDLRLMAITNHNKMDFVNFIVTNFLSSRMRRKLLPGVEIDSVMDNGTTPLHMVIIFKDIFIANYGFSKYINTQTEKKSHKVIYSPEEIVKILKHNDCLIIPHGDKDKGIFNDASEENIKEALKKVREGFIRIFDTKPSTWKLEKIKNYLSEINEKQLDIFGGVLFSDVRDWSKYDEKYRDFKMNAQPSFQGLIHSTSNPTRRFAKSTSINYNQNYISKIIIKPNDKDSIIQQTEIELNRGFNCVIGKSGSGKSLLLEMIKNEIINVNPKLKKYPFANHATIELFNEKDSRLNMMNINATIGENLYDKILSAYSENDSNDIYSIIKLIRADFEPKKKFKMSQSKMVDNIKNYCKIVEEYETTKTNIQNSLSTYASSIDEKNNLRDVKTFTMQLVQNHQYVYDTKNVLEFGEYRTDINSLESKLKLYKGQRKKVITSKISDLSSELRHAYMEMEYQRKSDELINKKILIINSAINSINGKISTQSSRKSQLTKLLEDEVQRLARLFADNFIRNHQIDIYDLSIKTEDFNSNVKINDNYNITVSEFIDEKIFTQFSTRDNNIFNTYGKKGQMTETEYLNFTNKSDAKKIINKYINLNLVSKDLVQISKDFNVTVRVDFNGQDISRLNPGDIAKTYIKVYFEEEVNKPGNHVVLFDQIENDVDKDFISSTIKELIENTKGIVQTIIVTHDPIIAVNADPNNYIEATKIKNKIIYRNFCAESDVQDELENIAKNVDGSKDVIRRRYEIYEGERK